jgi:type II secretory pathway pseudopilin PulG
MPWVERRCETRRVRRVPDRTGQEGFTFIGLMVIVTILGIGLLAVGEVWHTARQREKEQSLLFVGDQFRKAIKSYYVHTPATARGQRYPTSLEDMLKDPRSPSTQRHLRKIYTDPITGEADWGVLRDQNGAIIGVFSQSEETPLKQNNFRADDSAFEGKARYSEWIFMYVPAQQTPGNQQSQRAKGG